MRQTFEGFVDVHVHFRDPGPGTAETTASGLKAAARGGFRGVVTMPNTTPACDCADVIRYQMKAAEASGVKDCQLRASACLTKGRLGTEVADLEALAEAGAAFFTDDGSYVADDHVMEEAMRRAAQLGMVVCQHAMDPKELAGGVIRSCALAKKLGLPVISPETETVAIRLDLVIWLVTLCRLHIHDLSTADFVARFRDAQKEGLPVTAEATPHHLLLTCDNLTVDDAQFKMAPPLGTKEDRAELRKAVKDGVLMFATDHAPHPAETKDKGFAKSANGIIGLETAIPITYAVMVEEEGMSLDAWAKAWTQMPRALVAGLPDLGTTTVEIGEERAVDLASFASLARNCPYGGMRFRCWPKEG